MSSSTSLNTSPALALKRVIDVHRSSTDVHRHSHTLSLSSAVQSDNELLWDPLKRRLSSENMPGEVWRTKTHFSIFPPLLRRSFFILKPELWEMFDVSFLSTSKRRKEKTANLRSFFSPTSSLFFLYSPLPFFLSFKDQVKPLKILCRSRCIRIHTCVTVTW